MKLFSSVAARLWKIPALWHLWSLDAPTVAVVWTTFIAGVWHVNLHPATCAAMFVAVWTIYAGDRLLDVSFELGKGQARLPAPHHFHHEHRRSFRFGILVAAALLAFLLPRMEAGVLRALTVLAAVLAAWMLLVHSRPRSQPADGMPKELAVGFFFAAATSLPTAAIAAQRSGVFPVPALLIPDLLIPAMLFGAVCVLNCRLIHAWSTPSPVPSSGPSRTHRSTACNTAPRRRLGVTSMLVATIMAATASLLLRPAPIVAASAASAALLLLLDTRHPHADLLHLRVGADLALLTPLLWFAAKALLR